MAGKSSIRLRRRMRENRQTCIVLDRLGVEGVGGRHREPEESADRGEAGDLPAPVGQQLVQLGGAGGDGEEVLGRIAFGDEGAAGRDRHRQRERGQAFQVLLFDGGADAGETRSARPTRLGAAGGGKRSGAHGRHFGPPGHFLVWQTHARNIAPHKPEITLS